MYVELVCGHIVTVEDLRKNGGVCPVCQVPEEMKMACGHIVTTDMVRIAGGKCPHCEMVKDELELIFLDIQQARRN